MKTKEEQNKIMKLIKIDTTDVIFQNMGAGQGKIIISDIYNGSFSYYWGSMGKSLEEFIKSISSDYFANNLCNNKWVFSGKNTAYNIRKYIKDQMNYDLPWYKYLSAQKELRQKIKEIEKSESQQEALYIIERLHTDVMCLELDQYDEREFRSIIEDHFTQEPWHFLGEELSREYKFIKSLHSKLIKKLTGSELTIKDGK